LAFVVYILACVVSCIWTGAVTEIDEMAGVCDAGTAGEWLTCDLEPSETEGRGADWACRCFNFVCRVIAKTYHTYESRGPNSFFEE
jgi:hypothetical protein